MFFSAPNKLIRSWKLFIEKSTQIETDYLPTVEMIKWMRPSFILCNSFEITVEF